MTFSTRKSARAATLAVAAGFTLLTLAACGGGGGGGGGFGPGGQGISVKQPGLTAGGVTAAIGHDGTNATILIRRPGGGNWPTTPSQVHTAPSGWAAVTKLSPGGGAERFHAVTDIDSITDNDYLAYGYWSKNAPASLASSDFQPFFYGNMPYSGNVLTQPLGTNATYTGGAAGIYHIHGTSDYGHFKADFQLRANFGPGGTVVGSLTNIAHLASDPAFAFGNVNSMTGKLSSNGFSGPTLLGGRWGGRFFGPSGALPTGVAGWFEGVGVGDDGTRLAELYGSFGAKR